MNRREAIAALVALPEIARISTAAVGPTDVIVIECDEYLTDEARARISHTVSEVWPGRKVLVFDKGLRLKIAAGTE